MKVLVYPEKTREELGAVRWTVEWYTLKAKAQARFDSGDTEIDPYFDTVCHAEHFKSEAEAMTRAGEVYGGSFYGTATVQKQTVDWFVEEDRVAEWTDVGDSVEVS